MKHVPAEKWNLAWFRLAECVARGEQERALGVYRLLSHSLGNEALAEQLAGDIFLSFDDHNAALEKYEHAALLYQRNGNIKEAYALYQHMLTLKPEHPVAKQRLAALKAQSPSHTSHKKQDSQKEEPVL